MSPTLERFTIPLPLSPPEVVPFLTQDTFVHLTIFAGLSRTKANSNSENWATFPELFSPPKAATGGPKSGEFGLQITARPSHTGTLPSTLCLIP